MNPFKLVVLTTYVSFLRMCSFVKKTNGRNGRGLRIRNVLCLGNSITNHGIREDVGWFSNHGMAASSPEKDYCHQLEKMLDKMTIVQPINIAVWEREFRIELVKKIVEPIKTNNDCIIIRIGENVQDIQHFEAALDELVKYCKNISDNVMITGCYWKNIKKEIAILHVALKERISYIRLDWIAKRADVNPHIGDMVQDIQGNFYPLNSEFVLTHPNDKGMRLIAEEIFKYILSNRDI